MCFESAEMCRKAREAEEARRRKLADDLNSMGAKIVVLRLRIISGISPIGLSGT